MSTFSKTSPFKALLLLICLGTPHIGVWAEQGPNDSAISFDLDEGALSLDASSSPLLLEVMRQISELAGFQITLIAELDNEPVVRDSFDDVPIGEAINRLLSHLNHVTYYSSSEGSAGMLNISHVWILGPRNPQSPFISQSVEDPVLSKPLGDSESAVRSEDALRLTGQSTTENEERVLSRLIQMLQEDQDALVRARAAIALGALRDTRAIDALEAALLDQHSSVRIQAIGALGQIKSNQSTNVLGNTLLSDQVSTTERIVAAQALWKQNSKSAQDYLRIGASDKNQQVRAASAKPPAAPKQRGTWKTDKAQTN
ncbi:MAG: HEAT repeat domain-containing protein [bacterium]